MNHVRETWTQLQDAMDLPSGALPRPIGGLTVLQQEALAEGALGRATKALIALAVAVALPQDRLIPVHVHDALAAGATEEELLESVSVAVLISGATAAVRASEVLEVIAAFRDGKVNGRRDDAMRAAVTARGLGHLFHGQDGDDAGLG